MSFDNKLSAWLKMASVEQKKQLAEGAGTTVNYLYQIAGGSRPNISLKLAHLISRNTIIINKESPSLPYVSLDDLTPKED